MVWRGRTGDKSREKAKKLIVYSLLQKQRERETDVTIERHNIMCY